MSRIALATVFIGGVVVLAAVGLALGPDKKGSGTPRQLVVSSASLRWPSRTPRDWVDFADQVSVLRVLSEKQLALEPQVVSTGEGSVGREVTAVIESTVWAYPGSPSISGEVTFRTWGWVLHDGRLTPTVDVHSDRLEVGDRVVAPLIRAPESEWGPLAPSAVIEIIGGRTHLSTSQAAGIPEIRTIFDGKTPDEIASLLRATTPTGNQDDLRKLDPDARVDAVSRLQ